MKDVVVDGGCILGSLRCVKWMALGLRKLSATIDWISKHRQGVQCILLGMREGVLLNSKALYLSVEGWA